MVVLDAARATTARGGSCAAGCAPTGGVEAVVRHPQPPQVVAAYGHPASGHAVHRWAITRRGSRGHGQRRRPATWTVARASRTPGHPQRDGGASFPQPQPCQHDSVTSCWQQSRWSGGRRYPWAAPTLQPHTEGLDEGTASLGSTGSYEIPRSGQVHDCALLSGAASAVGRAEDTWPALSGERTTVRRSQWIRADLL